MQLHRSPKSAGIHNLCRNGETVLYIWYSLQCSSTICAEMVLFCTYGHCATAFSMQSCAESAYQPYADEYIMVSTCIHTHIHKHNFYLSTHAFLHRRRVVFNPGGGGGGGGGLGTYTDTSKLSRGWEHCKLHAFVHNYYIY